MDGRPCTGRRPTTTPRRSPLHHATARFIRRDRDIDLDTPAVVEVLLNAGADPNARDDEGWTPLHRAVFNGIPVVVEVFINAGADLNAQDQFEFTPLHRAVFEVGYLSETAEHLAAIELLLDAGADPNVRDYEASTPLYIAAGDQGDDSLAALELLLNAGADPNARGRKGWTPLHAAGIQNNPAAFAPLLNASADPNAPDDKGNLPWASFDNRPTIAELLCNAGSEHVLCEAQH